MDLKKDLIQLLDRLDAIRVMYDAVTWVDDAIIAEAEEAVAKSVVEITNEQTEEAVPCQNEMELSIPEIQAEKDCSVTPPNEISLLPEIPPPPPSTPEVLEDYLHLEPAAVNFELTAEEWVMGTYQLLKWQSNALTYESPSVATPAIEVSKLMDEWMNRQIDQCNVCHGRIATHVMDDK